MSYPAEVIALLKDEEFPATITYSQKFYGYCSVKINEESHNAHYKRDNINSDHYRKYLFKKNAIMAVKLEKTPDGQTYKKYKDALQITSARVLVKDDGSIVSEDISVTPTSSISISPTHMVPVMPTSRISQSPQAITMMQPSMMPFFNPVATQMEDIVKQLKEYKIQLDEQKSEIDALKKIVGQQLPSSDISTEAKTE